MSDSLAEVEQLVDISKKMLIHIYNNVVSSDLIDSELIAACAHLMETARANVNDFISIFKAKQKFVEKIKLMVLSQEQKKEILEIKHRQNLELIAAKAKAVEKGDPEAIDISGGWNTDQVIKDMASGEIDVRFSKEDDSTGIVKSAEFDPMEAIEREDEENEYDEEDEDGKKKRRKQD